MFAVPTSIQDSPVSGTTAGMAAIIWKENQATSPKLQFLSVSVDC